MNDKTNKLTTFPMFKMDDGSNRNNMVISGKPDSLFLMLTEVSRSQEIDRIIMPFTPVEPWLRRRAADE